MSNDSFILCSTCNFRIKLGYIRKLNNPDRLSFNLPVALSEEEKNRLMRLDINRALEDAYFPQELKGISPNPANFASIKYSIRNGEERIVCICGYIIKVSN